VTSPALPPVRLFVTGGSGFLGRHLVERARRHGWMVTAPSSTECDVRRRADVVAAIDAARPSAIAHLAYRRDERDTLVDGSRHVAEAATLAGARLVHLSTDLVFAGREEPYVEDDDPDPVVDYGRHKLAGERAVAAARPDAVVVRTSLLYGDADLSPAQTDVVDVLAGRKAMTFFTDEVRCPAHVEDVADAVLLLVVRDDVHGPLHVAGPRAISRADFAALTADALDLDVTALRTATIAGSGQLRPARVVLDSTRAAGLGITVRDPKSALGGLRRRSS
jgi:dTDP-4-dehydrorhamnose reductase